MFLRERHHVSSYKWPSLTNQEDQVHVITAVFNQVLMHSF